MPFRGCLALQNNNTSKPKEREERHGGGTKEQGRHFTEQGGDV